MPGPTISEIVFGLLVARIFLLPIKILYRLIGILTKKSISIGQSFRFPSGQCFDPTIMFVGSKSASHDVVLRLVFVSLQIRMINNVLSIGWVNIVG